MATHTEQVISRRRRVRLHLWFLGVAVLLVPVVFFAPDSTIRIASIGGILIAFVASVMAVEMPKGVMAQFYRPNGPICYGLELPGYHDDLHSVLMSNDLTWFWASRRIGKPSSFSPVSGVPATRALAKLSESNADELVDDLVELSEKNGFKDTRRDTVIFGVTRDRRLEAERLPEALEAFLAGSGPVEMVVVLLHDKPDDYVFVQPRPSFEVQKVLDMWDIPRRFSSGKGHTYYWDYESLGPMRLENLVPRLVSLAR